MFMELNFIKRLCKIKAIEEVNIYIWSAVIMGIYFVISSISELYSFEGDIWNRICVSSSVLIPCILVGYAICIYQEILFFDNDKINKVFPKNKRAQYISNTLLLFAKVVYIISLVLVYYILKVILFKTICAVSDKYIYAYDISILYTMKCYIVAILFGLTFVSVALTILVMLRKTVKKLWIFWAVMTIILSLNSGNIVNYLYQNIYHKTFLEVLIIDILIITVLNIVSMYIFLNTNIDETQLKGIVNKYKIIGIYLCTVILIYGMAIASNNQVTECEEDTYIEGVREQEEYEVDLSNVNMDEFKIVYNNIDQYIEEECDNENAEIFNDIRENGNKKLVVVYDKPYFREGNFIDDYKNHKLDIQLEGNTLVISCEKNKERVVLGVEPLECLYHSTLKNKFKLGCFRHSSRIDISGNVWFDIE